MISGLINWTYDTNTAINAIIEYADALTLQDPGPGYAFTLDRNGAITQIIWPPGSPNPVPVDYDPTLAASGFVEDISQIKAQLGHRLDPITGQTISGSIWNIDYEYHLEHGTKAMLQPTVSLAENILRPVFRELNDVLTRLQQNVNTPWEIQIHKGSSFSDIPSIIFPTNWPTSFDHWPRFQYMSTLRQSTGGYNETYPDGEYRVSDLPRNCIQVVFNAGNGTYSVNIIETALTGAYEGKLLVW